MPKAKKNYLLYTIGHSTRPLPVFISLLKKYKIKRLIDVRTIPRSRHNPQFNRETLPVRLRKNGIRYLHLKGLGGLRHALPDSINRGWRNSSFRGYADYMQTREFSANLKQLVALVKKRGATAIMCAEALPWRCHRSLIADALTVKGLPVRHIMSATTANQHKLTAFARVTRGKVSYPPPRS